MNKRLKFLFILQILLQITKAQEFMDRIENVKRIENHLHELFNGFRIAFAGKLTADGFEIENPQLQAKRFRKVSDDLKLIQDHYLSCLNHLSDNNYTEETIEECVGINYSKINNDIDYFKRQLFSKVEEHIRSDFIDLCYDVAEDEIMLQSCDLFEKDTLDVLWAEMNIYTVANINRSKYLKNMGVLPEEIFEKILLRFKPLYQELGEILQEIRDHNMSIVASVKESVDERTKLILIKAKESNGYTSLPKMVTHTIELTQKLSSDPIPNVHSMPSILMNGSTKLYAASYDSSGNKEQEYIPDNFNDLMNGPHVVIPIRKLQKRMDYMRAKLKAKRNKLIVN